MKIFISGGCKNGKSYIAQHLSKALQKNNLFYIATMKSADGEDDERIIRHQKERDGWGFTTVEQPVDIGKILQKCDINGSFLLDSLTALLANEMFCCGNINENASDKISSELCNVLESVTDIVIVSDYIYSDAILYDPLTEKYRSSLAQLDRITAKHCDVVLEVVFSNIIIHKGKELFNSVYEKIS